MARRPVTIRSRHCAGPRARADRGLRPRAAAACWWRAPRHRCCRLAGSWADAARRVTGAIHDRTGFRRLGIRTCCSSTASISRSRPVERPILTLIPTAMFGPPEKVWSDKRETSTPGPGRYRSRSGPRRVPAVGHRRAVLPPQLRGPRQSAGRSRRPSPAEGPPDPDERASARRDDADGSAVAQPDAGPPRERHRPPRHGVLRTRLRCATSASSCRGRSVAPAQSRSAATCRSPRAAAVVVHAAIARGVRSRGDRVSEIKFDVRSQK